MKKTISLILCIAISLALFSGTAVSVKATSDGWQQENSLWYFYSNGVRQTGWLQDGRTWYFLSSSGVMQTGWLQNGGAWYYFHASGAMATGWLQQGSTWYYLNLTNGAMVTREHAIRSEIHQFNTSGAWIGELHLTGNRLSGDALRAALLGTWERVQLPENEYWTFLDNGTLIKEWMGEQDVIRYRVSGTTIILTYQITINTTTDEIYEVQLFDTSLNWMKERYISSQHGVSGPEMPWKRISSTPTLPPAPTVRMYSDHPTVPDFGASTGARLIQHSVSDGFTYYRYDILSMKSTDATHYDNLLVSLGFMLEATWRAGGYTVTGYRKGDISVSTGFVSGGYLIMIG
jgi:hypothetical protein